MRSVNVSLPQVDKIYLPLDPHCGKSVVLRQVAVNDVTVVVNVVNVGILTWTSTRP